MEANSSRRQKRLRIPVRSHIQKRPRLASTQSETSTSEWIVEEVSHASSSIPAPEPSSVQPSGLTADDVLKLLTTIQNDFGSECSLMRDSDAQKLNLSKDFSNLPVLKGFGNSVVVPHYKSNIFVKIDEVESQIEILVVKDEFLQCPLLIDRVPTSVQNIRDEIDSNIKITQKKQKARYDVGRAPAVVFSEGDLVKISRTNYYNKGNSSKLLSKFIGPFRIIKVHGNDRYQIANIPGFGKNKRKFESVVASDRIRPWVNINVPNSDKTTDSSSSADSDDDLPLSKHN
ncbi:hypothetical protein ACJJTC_008649 [Scirpophaga incertulas]